MNGYQEMKALPLNSPKWGQLGSAFGNASEAAGGLAAMYAVLDNPDNSDAQIAKALDDLRGVCEDLYCQQSVYDGTAAAFPHLVAIAARLNPEHAISLLLFIAYLHYESPHRRLADDENQLKEWYQEAKDNADKLVWSLAKSHQKLAGHLQKDLFEAYAIFNNFNDQFYAIRDCDWYEFTCKACETPLAACREADGHYWVWKRKSGSFTRETDPNLKIRVSPTGDLDAELTKDYHKGWRSFQKLFVEGDHQFMLDWLHRLLGWFDCPECKKTIQIRYKWSDD